MRSLYVALVLCLAAPFFLHAAEVVMGEEIIAKINGDIVTNTDVRDDRKGIEDELAKQKMPAAQAEETLARVIPDILRNRIDEILLRQKGKDLNLKVEGDVNKQIANYQRQFKLPDPDAFQRFVVEQTGRSYEDFRGQIQDNLLAEGVKREEIYRKIQVPKEEVRAYYDEHKNEFQRMERVFLRELFISAQDKSPEEIVAAETKAKDLAARAKRGETFPAMVTNNSENELTKERGGLLDPLTRPQLNELIEAAVWDKEPGYVSEAIRFPNGWEIFKVEDHQREGLASFEEVDNEIQNMLFSQRIPAAERAYLTKLRNEAFLQIKEGYVDTGASPGKDTRWGDVLSLKPETIDRATVVANPSMKRLLGMFPVPGTEKTGASSSR
ncbi:MAG: peptidyl-prolyl cis-trans isomerase [Acidobacteriota bacterium]